MRVQRLLTTCPLLFISRHPLFCLLITRSLGYRHCQCRALACDNDLLTCHSMWHIPSLPASTKCWAHRWLFPRKDSDFTRSHLTPYHYPRHTA
ncbi:hypothetical protein BDV11DRAFT_182966 [Aspergillus similis]